jgi:predicted Zn-dependent protease
LNLGLAAAGAGVVGDIANLALIASISAYSRDHEREADRYGMQLMAQAGYDPVEASAIWEYLMLEDANAIHKEKGNFFTATHPSEKERAKVLKDFALDQYPSRESYQVNKNPYGKQLSRHFAVLMEDQLRLHNHGRSEVLLDSFNDTLVSKAELHYFEGEYFRLRKQEGDIERAMEAYTNAMQYSDVPADTYRQLGYLHLKNKDMDKAKDNFEAYLRFKPDASDRAMIEFYLNIKTGD